MMTAETSVVRKDVIKLVVMAVDNEANSHNGPDDCAEDHADHTNDKADDDHAAKDSPEGTLGKVPRALECINWSQAFEDHCKRNEGELHREEAQDAEQCDDHEENQQAHRACA